MSTPVEPLADWLAAEPYTLVMSSGFFGFFAHCGVLQALEEAGMPPAAVAGSSAGALVGGLWASGRSADELAAELLTLRREEFWDPGLGPISPGGVQRAPRRERIKTLPFGVLRGELFRERVEGLLGARSFEEARVPASLVVYDLLARRPLAVSEGSLGAAIHASCAVPGMFRPVRSGGRWCIDGGVADRPGLTGVAIGERVFYHHLASRSPWRRPGSPSLRVAEREGLRAHVVEGLPRVGPYRLENGATAYQRALDETRRRLGQ